MDWDEQKPKPRKSIAIGDNLETLSLAELEARIASFNAEIDRLRAEIARKKTHNAAAEGLFKR